MSNLISEIESFLHITSQVTEFAIGLETAEGAAVNGLTAVISLVSAGASIADEAATTLTPLLPSLASAIAGAKSKVDGWAKKVEAAITAAQTWLSAHPTTMTASLAPGEKVMASHFHIA